MKNYPVIGWFDGDKAGRNGFVKLRKALSPFGVEPKRISTPKDPKTYSRAAITQFIKDAL
jgi:DNA primase